MDRCVHAEEVEEVLFEGHRSGTSPTKEKALKLNEDINNSRSDF